MEQEWFLTSCGYQFILSKSRLVDFSPLLSIVETWSFSTTCSSYFYHRVLNWLWSPQITYIESRLYFFTKLRFFFLEAKQLHGLSLCGMGLFAWVFATIRISLWSDLVSRFSSLHGGLTLSDTVVDIFTGWRHQAFLRRIPGESPRDSQYRSHRKRSERWLGNFWEWEI